MAPFPCRLSAVTLPLKPLLPTTILPPIYISAVRGCFGGIRLEDVKVEGVGLDGVRLEDVLVVRLEGVTG